MSSVKCERCCAEIDHADAVIFITSNNNMYPICDKCWHEWLNDGHHDIWLTFNRADNFELSDKFTLDYLGKLGE